ncbi:MAG: hypothetical protein ABJE95_11610 [Byssovorax sp.]
MSTARKLPPSLIAEDDPLWRKFLSAPVDSAPAPEQEVDGLAAAKFGKLVHGATVTAEIARRSHIKAPLRTR